MNTFRSTSRINRRGLLATAAGLCFASTGMARASTVVAAGSSVAADFAQDVGPILDSNRSATEVGPLDLKSISADDLCAWCKQHLPQESVGACASEQAWCRRYESAAEAVIRALCHERDANGLSLTAGVLAQHLSYKEPDQLARLEALYASGGRAAAHDGGAWPAGMQKLHKFLDLELPGYPRGRGIAEEQLAWRLLGSSNLVLALQSLPSAA